MAKRSAQRSSKSKSRSRSRRSSPSMIFTSRNYLLLVIGVVAIVVGYAAMRIENQLDGFISLYVAPLLILGGYLEIIYAILWRPRQPKPEADAA